MSNHLDASGRYGTMRPSDTGKAAMISTDSQGNNGLPGAIRGNRRYRRLGGATAVLFTVLAVTTACTSNSGDDPAQTTSAPAPATSTAPTNPTPQQAASDSAVAAYREYIEVVDQVSRRGGSQPDSLKNVAISDALLVQQRDAATLAANKWRGVGATAIDDIEVKSISLKTDAKTFKVPEVILGTCLDATKAYAVDSDGKSVRPSGAPTHYKWKVWVRNYPKEGGVNGWFVARVQGSGVKAC